MTRLVNTASEFAAEALAGYAAAQSHRVAPVRGGVVRSTQSPDGQVGIVMGGGSGHFPAFAGWVGIGFGHGAACGNIFASPSEAQILSVARAADNGGGLLFMPINYAGDILHFTAAAEDLRAEGKDVRMVVITDDIASAPAESRSTRRGIAGSFLVLKMVGAAAEQGIRLDELERIAVKANEATRTFGVAFAGCTLPGSAEPLFAVPAGKVAIGLGIHGEPGISETELESADHVADILVDGLFEERAPERGRAVAVLVNGLGATKYDELHVVFGRVRNRLEAEGMRLVAPVVGEQVTSLDMAGVSVSLAYLDEELEGLWLAPADTASFSRGEVGLRRERAVEERGEGASEIAAGSQESRAIAAELTRVLQSVAELLAEKEQWLGTIDAVAGDGDHGAGMLRGARAAAEAAQRAQEQEAGAGTVLRIAADAWSDRGGGTSGALWGVGLAAAGTVIGDERAPEVQTVVAAVRAYVRSIADRGGAAQGDKTMMDAMIPFADSLEREVAGGLALRDAWRKAAEASTQAAEETAEIVSKRGRSRLHGTRSIGTPDAGAISFALIVSRIGDALQSS